jgi:hypothetical protein
MSAFTLVYTRALTLDTYSDKVNIPFPNVVKTGTNTAIITNQLRDSSANFNGIQVGDTVYNSSSTIYAYVTGFVDSITLLLSDDIFSSTGEEYIIYQGQNNGCYIYVPNYTAGAPSTGVIEVETIGGDIVTFNNPPAGVLPIQVFKVMPNTTIAKLVALW